jgi:hypothetical protein
LLLTAHRRPDAEGDDYRTLTDILNERLDDFDDFALLAAGQFADLLKHLPDFADRPAPLRWLRGQPEEVIDAAAGFGIRGIFRRNVTPAIPKIPASNDSLMLRLTRMTGRS